MGLGDPSFTRAATCQKCIRTGDIENVGKTPRHMTFFEMLGNFSFGDYFKKEAIHWAWEFLTKDPQDRARPPDRDRLPRRRRGVSTSGTRRLALPPTGSPGWGEDDNFWPAGAPSHGPERPCAGRAPRSSTTATGSRRSRSGTSSFTQYNRVGPGQLEPLPKKNIDTGMGLERMAAAMQGARSNFEIDIFKPLVAAAAESIGVGVRPGLRRRRAHPTNLRPRPRAHVLPPREREAVGREAGVRRATIAQASRFGCVPDGPSRAVPRSDRAPSWRRSWRGPTRT